MTICNFADRKRTPERTTSQLAESACCIHPRGSAIGKLVSMKDYRLGKEIMRTSSQIKDNIADLRSDLDQLIATSEAEQRDFTSLEASKADQILAKLEEEKAALETAKKLDAEKCSRAMDRPEVREMLERNGQAQRPTASMHDSHGKPIFMLGREQTVASTLAQTPTSNGLGELIRCVSTGRTHSWTPSAVQAALGGSTNLGGGILVPGELAAGVIDKARAASVMMIAGTKTIPMSTSDLTVARVLSDPEMEVKAENAAFSEASINFGSVQFHSHTIGCLITASRELAEDAPNFAELIEGVIARALATKLDYYAIQGVAPAPLGLINMAAILGTGSVGAIAWEDLAAASSEVRQNNHQPNSIILGVEPFEDLQIAVGGDGVNASKAWLMRPPALDGQQILPSNNCPLANAVVGDFSYAYWGIRSDARIEMTTSGDDAFEKHQLKLKIVFRGDFQVVDPSAFYQLSGITS